MSAAGRVLQTIGWIWVALGLFGPFLNLPVDVNLFPGIILVFVSRILRAQGARNAPVEYEAPAPEQEPVEQRILNTERSRANEPMVKPEPVVEREPKPRPSPAPPAVETTRSKSEPERAELEEKLLFAGMELASRAESEPMSENEEGDLGETTRPLSSAEMIAQAHKRWNKRP